VQEIVHIGPFDCYVIIEEKEINGKHKEQKTKLILDLFEFRTKKTKGKNRRKRYMQHLSTI
jgi:hypothetical protein